MGAIFRPIPTSPKLLGGALFLFVGFGGYEASAAEPPPPPDTEQETTSLHFQETTVTQGHPSFDAPYSGTNSLLPEAETKTSVTSTLFGGLRLWKGAEIYLNPELSGGSGLSGAVGVAGFPNGETFRIGSAEPVIYLARLFLRQTFDLGDDEEPVAPGPNQLGGFRSSERITVTVGRFGIADIFDTNRYSHDPRTQFLNWSLMNSGAWDYPADTRGYTWGLALEYALGIWRIRGAAVLVPRVANGLEFDSNLGKAHGVALENELHYDLGGREGVARLLLFLNDAHMGDYDEAVRTTHPPDITATRAYGRSKYGFAVSADQDVTDELGAFARLSWNDGRNETWAFTEIDGSVALGAVTTGAQWKRPADTLGGAVVLNAISAPHQRYLGSGGYGFIIGDGALNYGFENVWEAYYRLQLTPAIAFAADYQFIVNPAYNRDRGPVQVAGLRAHIEF
jgi:high affinity Mn2+ porin